MATTDKIPEEALTILKTIIDCKDLVKYVKNVIEFFLFADDISRSS
jgi:hypothetical protein